MKTSSFRFYIKATLPSQNGNSRFVLLLLALLLTASVQAEGDIVLEREVPARIAYRPERPSHHVISIEASPRTRMFHALGLEPGRDSNLSRELGDREFAAVVSGQRLAGRAFGGQVVHVLSGPLETFKGNNGIPMLGGRSGSTLQGAMPTSSGVEAGLAVTRSLLDLNPVLQNLGR